MLEQKIEWQIFIRTKPVIHLLEISIKDCINKYDQ